MPSANPEEFISRLAHLVKEEQQAEEQEGALLLTNAPLSLLERNGLALSNLQGQTSIGLGGRTLIELTRSAAYHTSDSFPPHDFRSGDLARVRAQGAAGGGKKGKGAAGEGKGKGKEVDGGSDGIDAVVYRVNSKTVILAMDAEDAEEFVLPERISMCAFLLFCFAAFPLADFAASFASVKIANPTTFTRQLHFLGRVTRKLEAAEPLSPLLSVLLGVQPLSPLEMPSEPIKFIDERLNTSQKEAVELALGSKEVALLWGPPGTGSLSFLSFFRCVR